MANDPPPPERDAAADVEGVGKPGAGGGDADHDAFVLLVINHQKRLFAYILSLVLERERASDILQQANLVLLEKESGFSHGTDFFAWAARVAYFEVLADRRRRVRDRHLFNDEMLSIVADKSSRVAGALDDRADALRDCLAGLAAEQRDLLSRRYRPGGSVNEIANAMGKTPGAVSAVLHRLRNALLDCVEKKLRALAPDKLRSAGAPDGLPG